MLLRNIILKTILWIFFFALLLGAAYSSFFLYKINRLDNKINVYNTEPNTLGDTVKSLTTKSTKDLQGAENERINILLLGIAGKGKPGQNLTDTIMIASINLKTNQVALLSLPRDLYVKIPGLNIMTKINSVYQIALDNYGDNQKAADALEEVVGGITSLDINYHIMLNFDGFKEIIDSVGGINITSEKDIYDSRYPGPNYSYETFEIKKGFHQLDGATALKYARVRHGDPDGDFGRAKRQQQILQATKNKIFSTGTLFNFFTLNKLLDALGDNILTDISISDAEAFFELSKKLDTNNVNNVVIDAWNKDSLLKVSHVSYKDIRAFVLIPRVGNYSEIQETAADIFDLNIMKRKKEEIEKENASIVLIDKSGDNNLVSKIKKLLSENFNYKNVSVANVAAKTNEDYSYSYDLTNGTKPFTLNELVKKLPTKASYAIPEEYKIISAKTDPDIIIVIGKDLIEKYAMEEGSVDEYRAAEDEFSNMDIINNQ